MLPRGLKLLRVIQQRQRLLVRRLHEVDRLSCAQHRKEIILSSNCQLDKVQLLKPSAKTLRNIRKFATADNSNSGNAANPKQSNNTTKTAKKTTKKTATEPTEVSSKVLKNAPPIQILDPKSISTSAADDNPNVQNKKMDIATSKGILSITTTIEDSKINDIVFEKTSKPKATSFAAVAAAQTISDAAASSNTKLQQEAPSTEAVASSNAAEQMAHKTAGSISSESTEKLDNSKEQPYIPSPDDAAKAASSEIVTKVKTEIKQKVKRAKLDINRSSLERNFITPSRAMADFLLKASDLEKLPKIKRRSPYEQEPPMTVYWRKDVETKAIEVWGSRENLLREILAREFDRKKHQQDIFTVKRRLRDYRREIGSRAVAFDDERGLWGKSGKVVLIAIGINGINFLFKTIGWLYSGSHSMFAEAVHSLADTINQLILAYGIHKSTQVPDSNHPYGYSNMKYVSSLISGVGIFCVGTGLSFYHGITGIMHPEPMQDFFWAFYILGGSMLSEGATLLVAMNEIKRSAKLAGMSFKNYVLAGKDPCVNVVLAEDAAAVASVGLAAGCMGLSHITGSPLFDAVGSLLVGGMLGAVASFIIYTNVNALVGKSINEEQLNKINTELESDIMIRAIYDVKGIDMGNGWVRYKAEMDFDGRELTRSYMDKQDLNELVKTVKSFQSVEELEAFLLSHGENIVDLMGGEIDRIEMKLRKKFPEIRHCDLEIL